MPESEKILILNPDGSSVEVETLTFARARELVEGYVEVLWLSDGSVALLNEDGQAKGLANNLSATHEVTRRMQRVWTQMLVGTVVFVPRELVDHVLGGPDDPELDESEMEA